MCPLQRELGHSKLEKILKITQIPNFIGEETSVQSNSLMIPRIVSFPMIHTFTLFLDPCIITK